MRILRLPVPVICLCFLAAIAGTAQPAPHTLTLRFNNKVGNAALVLEQPYVNILGDSIRVQRFRYYISNISVTDIQGNLYSFPADYYLVDAADSASQVIHLDVTTTPLKTIRFLLGVDSIRNVSGVQTGALDPLHGMFWTWNSGYIMAKLEGTSPVSQSPGQRFTYHIGGFRKTENTARLIQLSLPAAQKAIDTIAINANINAWFKGKQPLRIAETPICHSPGALAVKIADNYSAMFTLAATH